MTDKDKLRKLADAMYYAAQQLTTDASRLHKAMDDYHQFIVNDYHEEDPVSEEVWISADDDVKNAAEKTTRRFCKISLLSGDYLSLAEAQPQVNKESKLIAIKSFVCGAQWDRNKLMKEAIDGQLENGEDYLRIKCLSMGCQPQDDGKLVKLIIIKED